MANPVNPPPQTQLPVEFAKDPIKRNFFQEMQRQLYQLWRRTGGAGDFVSESQQNITSTSSRVSRNAARINSLELKEFEILAVTSDVTTDRNQILICKNTSPITVTLDGNALLGDEVHVKRRGKKITIIGSIDGMNDIILNLDQWSSHLVFDGSDWSII